MATATKYKHLITSYGEDVAFFRTDVRKFWFVFLLVALAAAPIVGSAIGGNYVPYLLNMAGIATLVALGLNFAHRLGGARVFGTCRLSRHRRLHGRLACHPGGVFHSG